MTKRELIEASPAPDQSVVCLIVQACNDTDVQQEYDKGILWLYQGQECDLS